MYHQTLNLVYFISYCLEVFSVDELFAKFNPKEYFKFLYIFSTCI